MTSRVPIFTNRLFQHEYLVCLMACTGALFFFLGQVWAASVHLAWDPPADNKSVGYYIYRGSASGGPYIRLNSSTLSKNYYIDETAENGQTYYYTVTAVDGAGRESAYCREVQASPTLTAPESVRSGPVVRTVADFAADAGQLVILSASAWSPGNRDLTFSWVEESSPPIVQIIDADQLEASFLAPIIQQDTTLTFILTVKDSAGYTAGGTLKVVIRPRS